MSTVRHSGEETGVNSKTLKADRAGYSVWRSAPSEAWCAPIGVRPGPPSRAGSECPLDISSPARVPDVKLARRHNWGESWRGWLFLILYSVHVKTRQRIWRKSQLPTRESGAANFWFSRRRSIQHGSRLRGITTWMAGTGPGHDGEGAYIFAGSLMPASA